jgi:hypothetical protein
MRYFKKIKGERVYLSPINIEDAEKYTEWLNDLEIYMDILASKFEGEIPDLVKKEIFIN